MIAAFPEGSVIISALCLDFTNPEMAADGDQSQQLMKKRREGKVTKTPNSKEILEEGRGQITEINFDVQSEHLVGHTQVVFPWSFVFEAQWRNKCAHKYALVLCVHVCSCIRWHYGKLAI